MDKTILTGIGALALLAMAAFTSAQGDDMKKPTNNAVQTKTAIFAGGCFWCMEPPFEKLDGVLAVTSGYTGGSVVNPTYEQVAGGGTGHAEAVQITYDPTKVSYQKLLDTFWRNIDPTDRTGQFVDRGDQYRSAIFYLDDEQRQLAEASKQALETEGRFSGMLSSGKIATEITPAGPFYPAEEYHQDYYKTNPLRYQYYRWGSGRDQYLNRIWGESGH
jgi:methionine-S-sulfoxide reductase